MLLIEIRERKKHRIGATFSSWIRTKPYFNLLCCFEWFQNRSERKQLAKEVLELCCFEWFQNKIKLYTTNTKVLELCCFEWFQNHHETVT